MTLADLIAQFRSDAVDAVTPYLWSDTDVKRLLNEAEQEAAIRAKLLFDDSTPSICEITTAAGVASYLLNALVHDIERAYITDASDAVVAFLGMADRLELDRTKPDWRTETREPTALIRDDRRLRFDCLPEAAYTLKLEVYRLPKQDMVANEDYPEIAAVHHRHLVQWALFRAYSQPDAETQDGTKALRAEAEFTRIFGPRPDASLRRRQQANKPHHNKAYW